MNTKTQSVTTASPSGIERDIDLQYAIIRGIGRGAFGVVYLAKLVHNNEDVAIKKVLRDKRRENRELQIMRQIEHRNVVKLKYFFYCSGDKKDEVYLNLILEYMPATVSEVAERYNIHILTQKVYMYQLFRALGYIHSIGICHRDIKPQNLLLNPRTSVLKLCDFGSAKVLNPQEENTPIICSLYYRAPELLFGAKYYTTKIDVWSAGTVLAELLLGQPFFPASSADQTRAKISRILGLPSRAEIASMNPYVEMVEPPERIRPQPLSQCFPSQTSKLAIDLVAQLLKYTPSARPNPFEALAHDFFDELRSPTCKMVDGALLPELFDFTELELQIEPRLNEKLRRREARR